MDHEHRLAARHRLGAGITVQPESLIAQVHSDLQVVVLAGALRLGFLPTQGKAAAADRQRPTLRSFGRWTANCSGQPHVVLSRPQSRARSERAQQGKRNAAVGRPRNPRHVLHSQRAQVRPQRMLIVQEPGQAESHRPSDNVAGDDVGHPVLVGGDAQEPDADRAGSQQDAGDGSSWSVAVDRQGRMMSAGESSAGAGRQTHDRKRSRARACKLSSSHQALRGTRKHWGALDPRVMRDARDNPSHAERLPVDHRHLPRNIGVEVVELEWNQE